MRSGVLFRDFLFIALLSFVAMAVWMLPWLNPPTAETNAPPPGNIVYSIRWPAGNTDVDLWVKGPGDTQAVGYSATHNRQTDLLRDDTGNPDPEWNAEFATSRGVKPGRYTANIHAFRVGKFPLPVEVEISLSPEDGKGGLQTIATATVELRSRGQERTVLSFTVDADGHVDPDSFSTVFVPLRNMEGQ